jgi:uncharacterized protein
VVHAEERRPVPLPSVLSPCPLLATAGALAAAVGGAGAAKARGTPAPAAGLAPRPPGGTVFTGDAIQGKRVVSALDVRDLEPGRKHLSHFQGVQTATGQHWYFSVMVAKGARPGRRVLLTGGVHGDEISPVHTLQAVVNRLDPARMSGTVTAAFDASRPAVEGMARRWPNSGRGVDLFDPNRGWPGREDGFGAPARHAALLFEGLFRPNTDHAIDFHTSATGMDMTALHLARMDPPGVRAMAELFPVAHILGSPAYPGLLSNALIEAGIPAFTPEIGAPRILDLEMIPLFVEGTMNVLKHHGVVAGPLGRTGRDTGVLVGNRVHPVVSSHGGFVELPVGLNDRVEAGRKVAVQRNAFGEVVAEYAGAVAGAAAARRTGATAEPGTPLAYVLHSGAARDGAAPYPE